MTKTKTIIPTSVITMFTDPRPWKHVAKYIYLNSAAKIGVVLATMAPNRDNHAQNKGELLRVIAGKRDGKIDEAYVVAVKLNGSGHPTYVCAGLAEEVFARIEHRPTIDGIYGPFWVLQEYDIDSDTEL
jgi:hypothetical protein